MSTRCNLIIKNDHCKVILYRHHDGYETETGADIYRTVKSFFEAKHKTNGVVDITTAFMAKRYNGSGSVVDIDDAEAEKPVYQLTDSIHGDIEHLWQIEVVRYQDDDERWQWDCIISHSALSRFEGRERFEKYLTPYHMDTFRDHINEHIEDQNERNPEYPMEVLS